MRTSKSWGTIETPNTAEWETVMLLVLAVAGIVHLLYKLGYVRKERRGRIIAIVLAIALVIGVALGISGV